LNLNATTRVCFAEALRTIDNLNREGKQRFLQEYPDT
jgi:hypothetical protein